jgi:hypothetical protein
VFIRGFEYCQRDVGDWNHEIRESTRKVAVRFVNSIQAKRVQIRVNSCSFVVLSGASAMQVIGTTNLTNLHE